MCCSFQSTYDLVHVACNSISKNNPEMYSSYAKNVMLIRFGVDSDVVVYACSMAYFLYGSDFRGPANVQ